MITIRPTTSHSSAPSHPTKAHPVLPDCGAKRASVILAIAIAACIAGEAANAADWGYYRDRSGLSVGIGNGLSEGDGGGLSEAAGGRLSQAQGGGLSVGPGGGLSVGPGGGLSVGPGGGLSQGPGGGLSVGPGGGLSVASLGGLSVAPCGGLSVAPCGMLIGQATLYSYIVFFDWDKSDLTSHAKAIIHQAAAAYPHLPYTLILVNGHADNTGFHQYNLGLSNKRARIVASALEMEGVPASVIKIHSYGDTRPLVQTGPGIREPQNRRTEIIIDSE